MVLTQIDITQNELDEQVLVLPTMKVIENGKIIHESNGLSYEKLIEVLTDPNLGQKN